MFAIAPSVALISLVVLATNMLSTFWYQYQIQYHYALVAVPALAMGTVWAMSKIRREVAAGARRVVVGHVAVVRVGMGRAAVQPQTLPYTWTPEPPGGGRRSRHHRRHPRRRRRVGAVLADRAARPPRGDLHVPDAVLGRRSTGRTTRSVASASRPPTASSTSSCRPRSRRRTSWCGIASPTAFTLIDANEWWRLYQRTSAIDQDTGDADTGDPG